MSLKNILSMGLLAAIPAIGLSFIKNASHVAPHVPIRPSVNAFENAAATSSSSAAHSIPHSGATAHSESLILSGVAASSGDSATPASIRAIATLPSQSNQQWSKILELARREGQSQNIIRDFRYLRDLPQSTDALNRDVLQLASIPNDVEQFKRVFGRIPDNDTLENTKKTAQEFIDNGTRQIPGSTNSFELELSKTPQRLVLITGHNEAGMQKLLDGGELSLNSMAEACVKTQKICVFLSCSSASTIEGRAIGVPLTLTYDEAARLSKMIVSFNQFAASTGATYLDLVTALPVILAVENTMVHVKFGASLHHTNRWHWWRVDYYH